MSAVRAAGRIGGSVALWLLTIVGIGSLAVWALTAAGVVQPLVVVSGSMAPAIETGDLLVATPVDAREVAVGDVATIRSERTGELVTHRVVELAEADGATLLRLQGDANSAADSEQYRVPHGETVWVPRVTIPGGGRVVSMLMRPVVAVPLVVGILALCALGLFPSRRDDDDLADEGGRADGRMTVPAARRAMRDGVTT